MRLTYVGPLVPELYVNKKDILMQDPDPKCRHFGILWHFGIFAEKSNKISNLIFSIFFLIFRLFPTFRLSNFTALVVTHVGKEKCL